MPNSVIHFEIHAADVARTVEFYTSVFGWTAEDWSGFAGMPYWGVTTAAAGEMGINGAIMQRQGDDPAPGGAVSGAVITLGSGDFDGDAAKILAAGGQIALPKAALPGMAWQGYFLDPAGNVFGLHQPDPDAR
ncbi:VOC family protein [Microbacterium gorillae]|uniref:VOC family protein n=1 Tax=Microbacterium gorillae TaxID=1231063 RepID=UPI0005905E4D|nr:VOC family protein [Microbacterium gorillae]